VSARQQTAVPAAVEARPRRRARIAELLEENGTLVLVVCAFAIVVATHIPQGLAADGWMALLSGREIVQHGLPSHDALTVWAHGRRWVDQQWLAQVMLYGLQRLGGLRLVMLVHAAFAAGGLAAAAVLTRRLGATARSATWICIPVLVAYYPEAVVMRPQSFTYVLFVAVFALLLLDRGLESWRVYLVFPALILWANLHGSVVVGAALVSLYGLIGLVGTLREKSAGRKRFALLTVLPWACILASPYAIQLPSYYEKILVGAHFGRYVTEWRAATPGLATAPLYLLVVLGAWLFGRVRGQASLFEAAAFFLTAAMAFQAVRNMAWFGLVAIAVLPRLLDGLRGKVDDPKRLNRLIATVALGGTFVTVLGVAAENRAWFLPSYPPAAADAAATAAGAHGRVFANEAFADWLVWAHPSLAGRIAFDSRFELLTNRQLQSIVEFRARVGNWQKIAAGYDVLVLDAAGDEKKVVRSLVRSGDAKQVATHGGIAVLKR
jgi:hypothetical protein